MKIGLFDSSRFFCNIISLDLFPFYKTLSKVFKVFCLFLLISQGFSQETQLNDNDYQKRFSENFHHLIVPGYVFNQNFDGACLYNSILLSPLMCQVLTDNAREIISNFDLGDECFFEITENSVSKQSTFSPFIKDLQVNLCVDTESIKHYKLATSYLENIVLKNLAIFSDKNKIKDAILFAHAILIGKSQNSNFIFGQLRNKVAFKPEYQKYSLDDWKKFVSNHRMKKGDKRLLFEIVKNINIQNWTNEELGSLSDYNLFLPHDAELEKIFENLINDISNQMQKILKNHGDPLDLAGFIFYQIWHCQMFDEYSQTVGFLWMNTILLAADHDELIFYDRIELEQILQESRLDPKRFNEYLHFKIRPWNERNKL